MGLRQKIKAEVGARISRRSWDRLKAAYRRRKLARNSGYDRRRFCDESGAFLPTSDKETLRASITFDYHRIEKGLALPEPRSGFGSEVARKLVFDTDGYQRAFGPDHLTATVRSVLKTYRARGGCSEELLPLLSRFLDDEAAGDETPLPRRGGTIELTRESLFPVPSEEAARFLTSRHSLRNYTGVPLSDSLIEKAVALAQCAPSVCNRQSGRIYTSNQPEMIARVLKHQNGNRGFGHTLGAVFIVASDLQAFLNVGERNQPFVDGGIMAMSLVAGLHAVGVGACMLNWSSEYKDDIALRREFGIPNNHVVVTMVGAGEMPSTPVCVTASPRRPLEDVLIWLCKDENEASESS